jgi:DNA-binding NarL/FixJ family response regulator
MAVRVLIVDDQESFRSVAREVVSATEGFEVVGEAVSAEESLVAARRLEPDLVLMDVHLQGMDGIEASRRLRAERFGVVVLLLSTYDQEDFAARLPWSGASSFISKAAFEPGSLSAAWAGRRAAG